jgi:methyl-accepting chemotaxis protein
VTAEERAWLDKIKQSEARATPLIRKIIEARRSGDLESARNSVTHYLLRALGAEPAEVKALANAVDRGELYHQVALRWPGPGPGQHHGGAGEDEPQPAHHGDRSARRGAGGGSISDQISEQNQHLSGRTEDQASSLEETASAMEELTPPSSRMPTARATPMRWRRMPPISPARAARLSARWC